MLYNTIYYARQSVCLPLLTSLQSANFSQSTTMFTSLTQRRTQTPFFHSTHSRGMKVAVSKQSAPGTTLPPCVWGHKVNGKLSGENKGGSSLKVQFTDYFTTKHYYNVRLLRTSTINIRRSKRLYGRKCLQGNDRTHEEDLKERQEEVG